ncbi:MAG: hypothetical protein RLZZ292_431 [Bacteroidota bacterium]|jgi:hypothetical protein
MSKYALLKFIIRAQLKVIFFKSGLRKSNQNRIVSLFFYQNTHFYMKYFLSLKVRLQLGFLKRSLLCLCLYLPISAWGQYDYCVYSLDNDEVQFAVNALKQITTNPLYLNLFIHGSSEQFSMYNQNTKKFQVITPMDVVELLEADKVTKNIILLSSTNAVAAQKLADALGKKDQLAKRSKLRQVISWDGEVLLYSNGFIKGNGKCYQYELGMDPKELTGKAIPIGNAFSEDASDFLLTNQAPNILIDWLNETLTLTSTAAEQERVKRWRRAASKLKVRQKPFYDSIRLQKDCFAGWYHLKELDYQSSSLLVDLNFLCPVAAIRRQYTRNADLGADTVKYSNAFRLYLKNCKYKTATIDDLAEEGLPIDSFEIRTDRANKAEDLETFLSKLKIKATTPLEKKWAIIGATEPNLAEQLRGNKPSQFPVALFKILYDLVETYPYDPLAEATMTADKYRSKLTTQINQKIGMGAGMQDGLTIIIMRDITKVNDGAIKQQGSRGRIFETWVREAWAKRKLFDWKKPNGEEVSGYPNQGKQLFYFAVTNEGKPNEMRTPIDKATATSRTRIIDCSYIDGGGDLNKQGDNCNLVGVELKHTTGVLDGEPLKQLYDNVKLVRAKKLKRIEYVFSTKMTAAANNATFITPTTDKGFKANEKGALFEVFFINDKGEKEIIKF